MEYKHKADETIPFDGNCLGGSSILFYRAGGGGSSVLFCRVGGGDGSLGRGDVREEGNK